MAIVGASSLRGKELKEVLEQRSFPAAELRLFDDDSFAGTLTEAAGEPTFLQALTEESFEDVEFAFFASSPGFAARHWADARRAGATVIDLSGALADVPTAIPWIPSLSAVLAPPQPPVGKLFFSPAPVAVEACTVAAAIASACGERGRTTGVERMVMNAFQPASERGQAGIDELEAQTARLLSCQPIPQEVFDAQVAFNLLAHYGESSLEQLGEVRAAVVRDVARYLAGRVPAPALQLLHAPVFFGHAFSVYAELSKPRPVEELERALVAAGAKLEPATQPSNVSVAGENQIVVARVERDPSIATGYWIWGAADNVRLAAVNAASIAEKLLHGEGSPAPDGAGRSQAIGS